MKKQIKQTYNKFKIHQSLSHFSIFLIIALLISGCVLMRLPAALNSRLVSEVYIKVDSTLIKISPGDNEGLFVTPNINPEGNEVIFHGAINGYSRIWKYDLNEKSVIALTDSDYVAVEPCYSWDGSLIAFVADKGVDQTREDMLDVSNNLLKMSMMYLGGNPKVLNLYVINSDGNNLRQLTTWDAVDMRPTFSPDGKHILFMSTYKSGTIKKRHLFKVSINGDEKPQQIPNSEGANRPWYSANGEWIYYWKKINKRGTLCRMSADGSHWNPIKEDTGGFGSHGPFIDTSGEWLWFHSVPDKDTPINQIFKMPVKGGNKILITPTGFEKEHVGHVTSAGNGNYSFDVLKILKKK